MAYMDNPVYCNSEFVQKLAEALGVPDSWRRIVIDIKFDDVAVIYIERLMDESELVDIDIKAGITPERKYFGKPGCVICGAPVSLFPNGTPMIHCFTHKTSEENEEFNQAWCDYVENK